MEMIALGDSGRQTSRLAFGCSRLMGSVGKRESLKLLETAFDAGVRHFDVARAYGHGDAEACVGEFLAKHRDQVTVATKHGVPINKQGGLKFTLRRMAVPVIEKIPGLKQRLQRASAPSAPGPREFLPFTADAVRASMEVSLRELRTDRIDLFLLHEVQSSDLTDDSLLRFLEDSVTSGKIGTFGVASGFEKIGPLLETTPAYCRVVQHQWSVFDEVAAAGPFGIYYRSLNVYFQELLAALQADKRRADRWSAACGAEVSDAETLARLMVTASLACNPHSMVLFSSRKAHHIHTNVKGVEMPNGKEQALKFYALVRAEAAEVVPSARPASEIAVRV